MPSSARVSHHCSSCALVGFRTLDVSLLLIVSFTPSALRYHCVCSRYVSLRVGLPFGLTYHPGNASLSPTHPSFANAYTLAKANSRAKVRFRASSLVPGSRPSYRYLLLKQLGMTPAITHFISIDSWHQPSSMRAQEDSSSLPRCYQSITNRRRVLPNASHSRIA